MNQKLIFLIVICISFIAVNSNSHAQKKYKFEKVVFGVDSIAKNSKGNNITGLIEKKTKKGKELGQYENGKKNGIYEFITPYDVVVKSETYQAGILNGPTKLFNMSGQLIESQNYSSGLLTGERNFYKAKQLIETQNYLNGKLHGKWIKWNDEHDTLLFEGNYIDGRKEGEHVFINQINKTKEIQTYQGGLLLQSNFFNNLQLISVKKNLNPMGDHEVVTYHPGNEFKIRTYDGMYNSRYFGNQCTVDENGTIINGICVGYNFQERIYLNQGKQKSNSIRYFTNFGKEKWDISKIGSETTISYIVNENIIGKTSFNNGNGNFTISNDGNKEEFSIVENKYNFGEYKVTTKYSNGQLKETYTISDDKPFKHQSWFENGQSKVNISELGDSIWYSNGQLMCGAKNKYSEEFLDYEKFINQYEMNGNLKFKWFASSFFEKSFEFEFSLFLNNDSITIGKKELNGKIVEETPNFNRTFTNNGIFYTLSYNDSKLIVYEYKDSTDFSTNTCQFFNYDLNFLSIDCGMINSSLLNLKWDSRGTLINGTLNGIYVDKENSGFYLDGKKHGIWIIKNDSLSELNRILNSINSDISRPVKEIFVEYKNDEIKSITYYSSGNIHVKLYSKDSVTLLFSQYWEGDSEKTKFVLKNYCVIEEDHFNSEGILVKQIFFDHQKNVKKKNIYSSNGTLENILEFKDNKVIKSILFNEKGEEVPTIKIGNQIWTAQNIDISHDRSGTIFTQAKTDKEWEDAFFKRKPAWCTSIYQKENGPKFGKLYNWYAMEYVAPEGWHVPSKEEWETLLKTLGGKKLDVTKILDVTTEDPEYQEWLKKNSYGFNARLGGTRGSYGDFEFKSYWWSTTEEEGNGAYALNINSLELSFENLLKGDGCFVRLIRDY